MEALKLPKNSESERAARTATLSTAAQRAAAEEKESKPKSEFKKDKGI